LDSMKNCLLVIGSYQYFLYLHCVLSLCTYRCLLIVGSCGDGISEKLFTLFTLLYSVAIEVCWLELISSAGAFGP
jgi:hypothetical protein